MEKKFVQFQLGLFFQSDFSGQFESISLAIKKQFGNDLIVQVLGLPVNTPPEIPRLVVNSENLNINLSKNRIDFFSKEELFVANNLEKIFSILLELGVKIGRIGVVKTFFKESTVKEFEKIFNQSIFSLNFNEVMVRFNEKIIMQSITVNDSHTYSMGSILEETTGKKDGVVITRDMNTLIEDLGKNDFTKEKLLVFVTEALSKENETLI
jgi:hypothetical protein